MERSVDGTYVSEETKVISDQTYKVCPGVVLTLDPSTGTGTDSKSWYRYVDIIGVYRFLRV